LLECVNLQIWISKGNKFFPGTALHIFWYSFLKNTQRGKIKFFWFLGCLRALFVFEPRAPRTPPALALLTHRRARTHVSYVGGEEALWSPGNARVSFFRSEGPTRHLQSPLSVLFSPLNPKSKKGQDVAGAHAIRDGGAPKSPYMRPQASRQDLSN
jgi:hypothetical protein